MNLVIVLFTFEETFSPLSPSFYLKVPLPSLASALTPSLPPPPHSYRLCSSLFLPPFRFLSHSLLTRFFLRWLRAWHRLCCDELIPVFTLPRQLENSQTRERYEKCCKAIGLGTTNTSVNRQELIPKKKHRSRFIFNKYQCNLKSTVEKFCYETCWWNWMGSCSSCSEATDWMNSSF